MNGTRTYELRNLLIDPTANGFDGANLNASLTIIGDVDQNELEQTKFVTYTENGVYEVEPSSGYDGLTSVTVTVNVPSEILNNFNSGLSDYITLFDINDYNNNQNPPTNYIGFNRLTINATSFVNSQLLNSVNVTPDLTNLPYTFNISDYNTLNNTNYAGVKSITFNGSVTPASSSKFKIEYLKFVTMTTNSDNNVSDRKGEYRKDLNDNNAIVINNTYSVVNQPGYYLGFCLITFRKYFGRDVIDIRYNYEYNNGNNNVNAEFTNLYGNTTYLFYIKLNPVEVQNYMSVEFYNSDDELLLVRDTISSINRGQNHSYTDNNLYKYYVFDIENNNILSDNLTIPSVIV